MNDDPLYTRRRIDALMDGRVSGIEHKIETLTADVKQLDTKVDALSVRISVLIGGLAVLSFLMNLIAPLLAAYLNSR